MKCSSVHARRLQYNTRHKYVTVNTDTMGVKWRGGRQVTCFDDNDTSSGDTAHRDTNKMIMIAISDH